MQVWSDILRVMIISCLYLNLTSSVQISDKRRCADPHCSVLLAVGRTKGKSDGGNGLLSYTTNEAVHIYSKEWGENKDLWGVAIENRRGYILKTDVQVDNVLRQDLPYIVPTELGMKRERERMQKYRQVGSREDTELKSVDDLVEDLDNMLKSRTKVSEKKMPNLSSTTSLPEISTMKKEDTGIIKKETKRENPQKLNGSSSGPLRKEKSVKQASTTGSSTYEDISGADVADHEIINSNDDNADRVARDLRGAQREDVLRSKSDYIDDMREFNEDNVTVSKPSSASIEDIHNKATQIRDKPNHHDGDVLNDIRSMDKPLIDKTNNTSITSTTTTVGARIHSSGYILSNQERSITEKIKIDEEKIGHPSAGSSATVKDGEGKRENSNNQAAANIHSTMNSSETMRHSPNLLEGISVRMTNDPTTDSAESLIEISENRSDLGSDRSVDDVKLRGNSSGYRINVDSVEPVDVIQYSLSENAVKKDGVNKQMTDGKNVKLHINNGLVPSDEAHSSDAMKSNYTQGAELDLSPSSVLPLSNYNLSHEIELLGSVEESQSSFSTPQFSSLDLQNQNIMSKEEASPLSPPDSLASSTSSVVHHDITTEKMLPGEEIEDYVVVDEIKLSSFNLDDINVQTEASAHISQSSTELSQGNRQEGSQQVINIPEPSIQPSGEMSITLNQNTNEIETTAGNTIEYDGKIKEIKSIDKNGLNQASNDEPIQVSGQQIENHLKNVNKEQVNKPEAELLAQDQPKVPGNNIDRTPIPHNEDAELYFTHEIGKVTTASVSKVTSTASPDIHRQNPHRIDAYQHQHGSHSHKQVNNHHFLGHHGPPGYHRGQHGYFAHPNNQYPNTINQYQRGLHYASYQQNQKYSKSEYQNPQQYYQHVDQRRHPEQEQITQETSKNRVEDIVESTRSVDVTNLEKDFKNDTIMFSTKESLMWTLSNYLHYFTSELQKLKAHVSTEFKQFKTSAIFQVPELTRNYSVKFNTLMLVAVVANVILLAHLVYLCSTKASYKAPLISKLAILESELIASNTKVDDMKSKINVREIEDHINQAKEIEKFEEKLGECRQDLHLVLEQIRFGDKKLTSAEFELKQCEEEYTNLEGENNNTILKINDLVFSSNNQEVQLDILKQTGEKLTQELINYEEKSNKYQLMITNDNIASHELALKLQTIENDAEEISVEKEKVTRELRESKEENNKLIGKIDHLVTNEREWKALSDVLNDQIDETSKDLQNLNQEVSDLQSSLFKLETCCAELVDEEEVLRESLDIMKDNTEHYIEADGWEINEVSLEDKAESIFQLNNEVESAMVEKESIELQIIEIEGKTEALNQKLITSSLSIQELEKEKVYEETLCCEAQCKVEVFTDLFNKKEVELQKQLGHQIALYGETNDCSISTEEKLKNACSELQVVKNQLKITGEKLGKCGSEMKAKVSEKEAEAHANLIAAKREERRLLDLENAFKDLKDKFLGSSEPNSQSNLPTLPGLSSELPLLPGMQSVLPSVSGMTSVLPSLPGMPSLPSDLPSLSSIPNISGYLPSLPGLPMAAAHNMLSLITPSKQVSLPLGNHANIPPDSTSVSSGHHSYLQ